MPFSYEFKLNRQKIAGVEIGFTTSRKWEEALDEAKLSLPLMETDSPISMLGLLQIEVTEFPSYANITPTAHKTYDYLVYSDVIKEATKYGRYQHQLSMIEYTAKLDYYIMPSLAKSRSIVSNVQAPFITDSFVNGGTNDNYQITVRLPYLEVKSTYISNTEITFPQVDEAFIVLNSTGPNYRMGGTYISTNAPLISGSKPHNLSTSPATWKFPKGKWELYYGWVSQAGDSAYAGDPAQYGFHALYTFQIKVIDSQELSMYDFVDEIRTCISRFGGIEDTIYYDSTRVFNMSSSDAEYLKTVPAPQMYLENATARQMLIFVFSYINGLPRLEWGEQIDTLKIERYNLSMGVFSMDDIVARSGQQNTNQIGSRSYSKINQALPNNMDNPSVYSPSQSGRVQVRATVQQITASEFEIKLPENKPIYVPIDLIGRVNNVVVTNTETNEVFNFGNIDLSIMPRFINKDEWFLKNITNDFPDISTSTRLSIFSETIGLRPNRISNLSWQIGDTSIKLSDVYGAIFESTLVNNVFIEALREYVMLRIPVSYDATSVYRNYTLSYSIPSLSEYKDWQFRVEYITDETMLIKQEKEDISQINFYSEMRHNQDEALVNIVRQSRKGYGDLQRTGNVGYTFTKLHTSLSQEYKIGQRDVNGFTINEIHTEWHNNYFLNTYVVTKHHNRISQATFVDQTYRWRDNYAKTVLKRHENYTDYLIVAPPNEDMISEFPTKIYSNYTVKVALGILFESGYIVHNTKVTTALIRTDGMLENYQEDISTRKAISVPVSSFGIKGGFAFTFGFENNQVAGDSLVERGTNKWYNQAVRYTNEEGRFTRFSFWLLRDRVYSANDYYSYPLLTIDENNETDWLGLYDISTQYFGCGNIIGFYGSGEPMVVNKDPLTNYNKTYQLNVISYYQGLYVFGLKFYTDNLLVTNARGHTVTYLYVYQNGERYEMFEDLFVKQGYATSIVLTENNMTLDLSTLRIEFFTDALAAIENANTTSWAIGTQNGDLLIACNEALNGFKIYKAHVRPNLWEIGLKAFSAIFYTLDSTVNVQLGFTFARGLSLAYALLDNDSLALSLNMSYYRSYDIGFSLNSETSLSLSFGLARGKSIAFNIDSGLNTSLQFAFGRSLDIGLNLDSTIKSELVLSYSIGDSSVMSLGTMNIANALTLEFNRTLDIGFSLNSNIPISLTFAIEKGYNLLPNIGGTISSTLSLSFYRSKNIGFSLNSTSNIGLSINYNVMISGYQLDSNIGIGLTFSFVVGDFKVATPSIINKTIEDAKQLSNSTFSYWNSQPVSNRTTIEGYEPNPYDYPIDFAIRYRFGTDEFEPYRYVRVTKSGDIVRWRVVNNDEAVITVFAKVGSGSYINYGSLGIGATSSLFSRTVTDGQTTVYVYGTATGQTNSDVASL